MSRWPHLGVSIALCVTTACAEAPGDIAPFLQDDKADGKPPKLHALDDHRVHVDEPSDLAVADGRLITVSDAHSKIYLISRDGDVEDVIDVQGRDLEAVGFDGTTGELLVADESRARIWWVGADGARHRRVELPDADDGNSGIEGLAFAPDGTLLVAKEKDPARIFTLAPDGTELARKKIHFADDLSALAFDELGRLYALSDEDHALFRLDAELDAIAGWRLPIEHPEGLAFVDGLLYVVSDSEERIYVFEVD